LDLAVSRLGRPSGWLARQQAGLSPQAQRLRSESLANVERHRNRWRQLEAEFPQKLQTRLMRSHERLDRAQRSLALLDPRLVLQRGYALLSTADGRPLSSVAQAAAGDAVHADLADGALDLAVQAVRPG
ncbi:MAG: exodeoxyribonuclease large subunit, partial [Rhodoferax sp.]|nr:exodeoxyribonuclease large subunit [Rhodoferax sp.]